MHKKVCILYGFGEGPAIGKELIKRLHIHGFELTSDASGADYIIAHSGGLFFLPKTYNAKLFLLVGINDRIDSPVFVTQYKKVTQDFVHAMRSKRHWYWFRKSFWNLYYLFRQLNRGLHMLQIAHHKEPFIPSINNAKVIIINYKDDPWSKSLDKKHLEKHPAYKLITLSGLHDDLWENPNYYIKLLDEY